MALLHAKQLRFAGAGDLIVGGASGNGTYLTAGNSGQFLKVIEGGLAWGTMNKVVSDNGLNSITATDGVGIVLATETADGTGTIEMARFVAGATNDHHLVFTNTTTGVSIGVDGAAENVDIILEPKGDGEVVIGAAGLSAVMQAEDGTDLYLMGGKGGGNLFLAGGDTGKVYYGDSSDAMAEIATLADIQAGIKGGTGRSDFTGDEIFQLPMAAVATSVVVTVNGLGILDTDYTVNNTTKILTFDLAKLGYTLDNTDHVVVTYTLAN